jgi:hypothetical protein
MAITFDGELVEIVRPQHEYEIADIEDSYINDLEFSQENISQNVVQLPTTPEVLKELDSPPVPYMEPDFDEVKDVEEFIDKFYEADNEVQLEIMAKHVLYKHIDPKYIHAARQLYILRSVLCLPNTLALVKKIVLLNYICSPKFIDFNNTGVSEDDLSLFGLIIIGVVVDNKTTGELEHLGLRFSGSFGEYADSIIYVLSRKIELEGNLTI